MTKQILADPKELVFIQSRAETNNDLVDEYANMMRDGVQFDAAQGVRDEVDQIFVYDGLHRGEAAKLAGIRLLVETQSGTRQDAEWLALSANQKHGLRRSRKDRQRVVRNALLHPYGASLSDREIARHCGVDHKTVGKVRAELQTTAEIPPSWTSELSNEAGQSTNRIPPISVARSQHIPPFGNSKRQFASGSVKRLKI